MMPVEMLWAGSHQVEFTGGKVRELIAIIIAESMYAQYDTNGNDYLLFNILIDYHNNNKVISLIEQQINIEGRLVSHKFTADWQIVANGRMVLHNGRSYTN